jgi:sulfatase maturation enzyme AslB (radical SAM superfamily)
LEKEAAAEDQHLAKEAAAAEKAATKGLAKEIAALGKRSSKSSKRREGSKEKTETCRNVCQYCFEEAKGAPTQLAVALIKNNPIHQAAD